MVIGALLLFSSTSPTVPQANTIDLKPPSPEAAQRIHDALQPKPAPTFPDTTSNYQNTVVIPAQKAAEAAAAAKAAQLAAEQAQASQNVSNAPTMAVATGGTCSEWLAAAGVTDIADAMYVINIESSCNPNALNRSSGACGIGQALPCSKMPCSLGDGACQVKWMAGYVAGSYGSWAAAAAHERAFNWY